MLVDFILHKANGTDTVELNKSIDGYSVVLNPKLHDVYNQVSYVEFDVAMSMDNYIEIGDWIEVDGKKYYSLTNFASFNARIAKGGTYNVRFYSPEQWLYKANMYATNEIYSGGVYSWERVDNTIVTVGNLESFGRWLCWNTNAQQNTRMFKLGNVPTGMNEQYEVLDFNPANCLSALYSICKTYKVRYEVVPNTEASPDSQYIINFYDTDEVFPVTFKYEEENGLYKLELTGCDEEVYTQFEIAGSTENIPSSYRDTRLRLSESISALSILDYPDLYDKWGRSIKILTYENIKPTRTGTVTDIVVDDIYSFIDSSLIGATWSPVGGTIQVVEGPLMGFSFECDYFNSANGRVHIKPMTESNGMELPSADLSYYRFTAGATPTRYNVVGIALPDEYIEDAEARLLAAAMNDTSYYSDIRASYSLAISGTLLEEGEYEINAGVLVPIQHLGIGLDRSVRVQSITYDLSKPKYYDIEEIQLSDFRQEGLMDMVTEGVRKSVATLKDVGYTNKLNTFANSVSTIKQGIAKSLGYESWEDFMEKTWNGEDDNWEANTIIVESLINSQLINVETLIAREAFIGTLLTNELFISGIQDETESLVNNYLLYLTSSVATVSCDSEGTVTGTLPTSTAIVYHGASADTGWSFSGELSGCTGSVNSSTGIITITGLTADNSTVTVSATKTNKPTLQAIFRISKVYAGIDGADGVDAAYYYLTPSVDAVVRSMDGTATPSTVSCAQYKIQGGGTPVAANKTIKYQRSIDGTMQTYSTAVAVSTSIYIDFYLYDGVTELWRTRVPVLHDLDEWESTLNDFAKGLGYTDTVGGASAYEKLVGAALAGETIMEGGYLRNSLIDTENLIASDAFINRIAANSITIGKITDTAAALDDAIQIGGRNLIRGFSYWVGLGGFTHDSSDNSINIVDTPNYYNPAESHNVYLSPNSTYTLSFNAPIVQGICYIEFQSRPDGGAVQVLVTALLILGANVFTFNSGVLPEGETHYTIRFFGSSAVNNISVKVKDIKLEKGNKATDWTPAPEDVQAEIDANASALSDFEGVVTDSISGLQAQIDGVVDSWFYAYTPTTANYPASEWTTTELRQRHIGDTFTNTQEYVDEATTPDAGKSWRWVESSGVYSWTPIADSDAVKALLAASTAQDTADGKRRVFTTTPTPPYDKDDLWSGGSSGDLKISTTSRAAGSSYVAGDWVLATKYTDDTAVTSLESALGNLAYEDMVSAAKLDSTIIDGGYIKTSLINANTIAAGTLIVSAINDSVDAIQIGGRNLLKNIQGAPPYIYSVGGSDTVIADSTLPQGFYVKREPFSVTGPYPSFYFPYYTGGYYTDNFVGEVVTVSFYIRGDVAFICDGQNIGTSWTRYVRTRTWHSSANWHLLFDSVTGLTKIEYHSFKIERGNKATDWTPAPEDVQEDYATKFGYSSYSDLVAQAAEGLTIINGGYLNTELIEARSIVAGKIATGTITANEIKTGTITANEIANSTITGGKIAGTTITAANIANSTITGGKIAGTTITAANIAAGTITANEIEAGTITANEIDVSSLTTDSAFITAIEAMTITADSLLADTAFLESLATKSAFIEELTGNTAFISALTVNSLSTVDSDGTSVSISNSAYSSKAGVVVSGSSGSVSMGFFDSVSAPALVAYDGTLGTGLSASGVIGWGGGSFSLGSGKYTVGETLLELQGAGSNYFSISSKSSGNAILSSGEFSISKNKLYISTLPTSTQTGGHFWSDSKGHVMVGAASAYTAADVGAVPTTRTVNSKALSANITLSASDVGAVPTTRKVNSKALSADITLSASDVGAVPTTDIQYFTQAAWDALNTTQKNAIKLAIVY